MTRAERWLGAGIVCPRCRGELAAAAGAAPLRCADCRAEFPLDGGVPWLRIEPPERQESLYFRGVRGWLRCHRRLHRALFLACAPVLVTGPDGARRLAPIADAGELVLDVGGGNDRRHERFLNVDLLPYPEVDVVADAARAPFRDGAVAGVLSIAMLEHAPSAERVLAEFARVLRPRGRIFLVVPFLQPFHAAPHDYRRWTLAGLVADLERHGLAVRECGVYCGPASALAWHLAEWGAHLVSLGIAPVRKALSLPLQALCSPLKWLDVILARLPGAACAASALWAEAERS